MNESAEDRTMDIIIEVYNNMSAEGKRNWAPADAQDVVSDQIKMDAAHGLPPTVYDARDFYETIRELVTQDGIA